MGMYRHNKGFKSSLRPLLLAIAATGLFSANAAWAGSFDFTSDADWATGVLTNTTSDDPPNTGDGHVRLVDNLLTPFDNIWVAASGRGTVIRIDTDVDPTTIGDGNAVLTTAEASGTAVQGEYRTAPSGRGTNPSRTTVDLNGDVWVGNRAEISGQGSIAKISANPTGTSSNGIFGDTSNGGAAGTFNALPWTNAGGADNAGGTTTAADSANLLYVRTAGTAVRTMAVDANSDVWAGGYNNKLHQRYDGDTGLANSAVENFGGVGGNGGYGGLVDGNGVLWSSGWSNATISKYDPATNTLTSVPAGGLSYGLAVDNDGNIWNTHYNQNTVSKIDGATNAVLWTVSSGGSLSRGVAITPDNNAWIANSGSNTVTRLDTNGNIVATIPLAGGRYPTGISIDSNGKVWVTNRDTSDVMRIDPATNTIDLTVDLGPGANPYNYSDMTGTSVVGTTNPSGTWRRVLDGGSTGVAWDSIFFNTELEGDIPALTDLVIEVRTSNDNSTWSLYQAFNSGDLLGLTGRYLEVRATLTRPGSSNATPVLSDLLVNYTGGGGPTGVPAPTTISILAAGLLGMALRRRRRG